MRDTQRSPIVYTKLRKIAQQAKDDPELVFSSLAHLMDVNFLEEAYYRLNRSSATGMDKVTWREYGQQLVSNLEHLHTRLKSGHYRATPIRRVWLEKEDKKKRPIGIPILEDKVVQRAESMLLESIYEQDFYDFSYGFRPRRSPHQALKYLRDQCVKQKVNWIVDADISGFFDNIDHQHLQEILSQRVNDGALKRLIGKWLKAGVLENEEITYSSKGTPQGGVISPLLANIYLHTVLDDWFVKQIQPRLRGRCFIVRFADDFVIGCELESDARRILAVLPKRFGKYGLSIHPEKTKLVAFGRPDPKSSKGKGDGTFDFLGFTHYWSRSRRGFWVIKRKTMSKRLRRAIKATWMWCKKNRHMRLDKQHRILCSKIRGHMQYYGVRCNMFMLEKYADRLRYAWRYWLSRRCHKGRINWENYEQLLVKYPLPKLRIVHNI